MRNIPKISFLQVIYCIVLLFQLHLIQLFDIDIENLPQFWIIRYTNPITQIRHEKIYEKKTI